MQPLYTELEFQSAKSRQLLPLKCLYCNKTFFSPKYRIHRAINPNLPGYTGEFCSKSCLQTHKSPPQIVTCTQCGKSFSKTPSQMKRSKNHFCSRSCAGTYNNSHKTKGTRRSKLEKWLESQLPSLYPNLEFHFNRKDAINSELDIYIPSLKLAFELNGIFHYEPIFGPDKLSKTQKNDKRKFIACYENNISLCIIDVSSQKYFKPKSSMKFLKIVQDVIASSLSNS